MSRKKLQRHEGRAGGGRRAAPDPGTGAARTGELSHAGSDPAAWAVVTTVLTLAFGSYLWLAGGPIPLGAGDLKGAADPFPGLPGALGIGLVAAALLVVLLGSFGPTRAWGARLAVAAGGLYLAGGLSAIGRAALIVAPAAVLVELAFLKFSRREPKADVFLLALHAGGFMTAICFFHQWPRYQSGWEPFLANLAALRSLWL